MLSLQRSQGGFSLIELMVVVAVIAIVAAIAIPNYLRYQAKSRQSEAKVNLSGIYVSEVTFFSEQSRYGTFQEISFEVASASNRYAYRLTPGGAVGIDLLTPAIGADPGDNVVVPSGISPPPAPGFTATATANLDADATIDMWHVNDLKRGLDTPDRNDSIG